MERIKLTVIEEKFIHNEEHTTCIQRIRVMIPEILISPLDSKNLTYHRTPLTFTAFGHTECEKEDTYDKKKGEKIARTKATINGRSKVIGFIQKLLDKHIKVVNDLMVNKNWLHYYNELDHNYIIKS